MNGDILEALVDLLPFEPFGVPPPATRTFAWSDKNSRMGPSRWSRITTREDGRLIVDGTTGLRTWQASISLANHFIARPELLAALGDRRGDGRRPPVLELGAGAGLLSLCCARLIASGKSGDVEQKILATDVDETVLANLTRNIMLSKWRSA